MTTSTEPDVRVCAIDDLWWQFDILRSERGMTWEDVADAAGLHRAALVDRRSRMPRVLRLGDAARLMKALGYELSLTVTRGL